MAFATLQEITTTTFPDGTGTTHNVNYPATVAAGDLLLLIIGNRNSTTLAISGFTQLFLQAPGQQVGAAYFRRAAGTEGGTTINVDSSPDNTSMVAKILRYKGHHISSDPEAASATGTSSQTPDPPSLTPSWGIDDTVWVACAFAGSGELMTVAPTNYINFSATNTGTTGNDADCAVATRDLNAGSENPGTFTMVQFLTWSAGTIAIRPAAAPVNRPMFRGS